MALETVEIDNGPRLVSPEPEPEDFDSEASLRPKTLEEYIGQDKAKENLKIYLQAAKMRWIICFCTAHRASAKRPLRVSWPTRWACRSASQAARPLKNPATLPLF